MLNIEIYQKYVNILKADGYVIIKNCFNDRLLSELEKELESMLLKGPSFFAERDFHYVPGTYKVSSLHNLMLYSVVYDKFIKNPNNPIKYLARCYFNDDIKEEIFNASYFAKPERDGVETKVHQDNAYFNMKPPSVITCWFGLDNATRENGGLYYYKGSQTLGNLSHQPNGNLGASQTISEDKEIYKDFPKTYISLKRGDCVVHDALTVHGSDANHSDFSRRGFNFSYAAKNAQRDKVLFENYQGNLAQFLKIKKK